MAGNFPHNYFTGLSGLQLPVPKYSFPPEFQKASRLTYYATFFNSLEVNSSFYKIPMKKTITRWAESVPDNFRFTFKLFKEITHCKNLEFEAALVETFMQTIRHVGDKRGCLLVQFPPSISSDYFPQVEKLFACIQNACAGNVWNVAVEFRNRSWYQEEVYDLLSAFNFCLVLHDIPSSATPIIHTSSEFVYVRFHGPTGNYRGSYSELFLSDYTEHIKEWLSDGKEIYVYFNNTAGDAFNNMKTFNQFLSTKNS